MADETRKPHTKRQIDKVLGGIKVSNEDWAKVLHPRKRAAAKPAQSQDTEKKSA